MPTFILGAGFNVDAAAEAGRQQSEYGYPLVGDTLRLCFDMAEVPAGKSIEDLFSEALEQNNYEPIRRLACRLRRADYYVARELALARDVNCYQQFFRAFPNSSFLTFNYDSLPETFLFRLGRWFPRDGYGVRVAHLPPGSEEFADRTASAFVLHLHGSLCIRISEFEPQRKPGETIAWLKKRNRPRYAFDPSSISANFTPFGRYAGADDVEDRILAPVRNKLQGLKQRFILRQGCFDRAGFGHRDCDWVQLQCS